MLTALAFGMVATFMALIMTRRLAPLTALILIPIAFGTLAGFAPRLGPMMLDGIKNIVNSMAGVPGRKAIVYVSDGLQMMVGQDVYYAVHNKYGEQTTSLTEATQYDLSRRFRELTAQANANRVTFYTIDAAGLRTFSSNDASVQGPGPTSPGSSQLIDSIQIQNVQSTLQTLAEDTGGQVLMNSNSFTPGLEKIARDFSSYYSLGYTPPHFGDGRYYKIDVKLKK
ncbi:MAG: VWA domain-containing protein, partial [Gemmatimonadetes bacterium]|nr:VWA domain-containing protein [Gemmatimonadota bacterium]